MISDFNKKGNFILDIILVMVILFAFGIAIFAGFTLLNAVNDDIQSDSSFNTEAKLVTSNYTARYPSSFDTIFMMAVVFLWIFFIISTFFMDSNPIFFVIFLILLVIVLIVSVVINNTWYDVITQPEFEIYHSSFPMIMWYFDNILVVWIVIGLSSLVSLIAKSRQGEF